MKNLFNYYLLGVSIFSYSIYENVGKLLIVNEVGVPSYESGFRM